MLLSSVGSKAAAVSERGSRENRTPWPQVTYTTELKKTVSALSFEGSLCGCFGVTSVINTLGDVIYQPNRELWALAVEHPMEEWGCSGSECVSGPLTWSIVTQAHGGGTQPGSTSRPPLVPWQPRQHSMRVEKCFIKEFSLTVGNKIQRQRVVSHIVLITCFLLSFRNYWK